MVEYVIGTIDEKDEIVDFINYVFSQAHRPHDFITLMPKSYGDRAKNLGAVHYMAKKDGKIKALVAMRIIDVCVGEKNLKYGLIGNVSVHPYSRGEGYMKQLMQMSVDDAKKRGVDIMLLAGQRQRYGYFGFENAGACNCYTVSKANIRHCYSNLDTSNIKFRDFTDDDVSFAKKIYEKNEFHSIRPTDEFVDIMHTWNKNCRTIFQNGEPIGYVYGSMDELALKDESDFPLILKAIFENDALKEVKIKTHFHQRERSRELARICESSSIEQVKMINVLNWEKAIDAFMNFKSKYVALQDGRLQISIEGDSFELIVSNGKICVSKVDSSPKGAVKLSHMEAQRLIFSMCSVSDGDERFKNWLPLPLMIDAPDGY
ncbi:MAG: GNAT family N-acetyltransferase [Clostridia bacterium]|nr:GNAT family N-acetyltransferase [Clostridia bacterium]